MKLTWKDGLATLLVAGMAVLYGFYLALGAVGPAWVGVQDATGMAAVGLGVGVIITALAIPDRAVGALRNTIVALRLVSVVLGVLALLGENLFSATVWESVLAAFMASLVLLWGLVTAHHAGLLGADRITGAPTGLRPV